MRDLKELWYTKKGPQYFFFLFHKTQMCFSGEKLTALKPWPEFRQTVFMRSPMAEPCCCETFESWVNVKYLSQHADNIAWRLTRSVALALRSMGSGKKASWSWYALACFIDHHYYSGPCLITFVDFVLWVKTENWLDSRNGVQQLILSPPDCTALVRWKGLRQL